MTRIVSETDGTLDKYIGDAVMAFWDAPIAHADHAVRGTEAALRMLEELDELSPHWAARGLPPIAIGIGLNTGPMRVGNMGSDLRLSYTVMGDNVNLGARLEGLTKYYGVRLIAAESTWRLVEHAFHGRELEQVIVKGKEEAVPIHEVIGRGAPPADLAADIAAWNSAKEAYAVRDWAGAEAGFRLWHEQRGCIIAANFLDLIEGYKREEPGPDWRPVRAMDTK